MRPYLVEFKGSWLGGKAVVLAHSKMHAEILVREENPQNFVNLEINEIPLTGKGQVLYLDDGEY